MHLSKARYKVIVIGRRGGKTEFALNELIDRAMEKPGLYWFVSVSYRQAKSIAWVRLKQLLKNDPYWKYNEAELSAYHKLRCTTIELRGADNEDSLRGVGLQGLIVDESAMVKGNVWPEILRPMLADTEGWAIFISTPKGRNWFYELYTKAISGDDSTWAGWRHPTAVNAYIAEQEILDMKRDMSDRLFRQEVMAEFLDDELGVFRGVRKCSVGKYETPVTGRFYIMGVDLAKSVDYTVLTVIDTVTRNVVAWERFQNVEWKEQKYRIQKLALKYNQAMCIVDSTGVGDPIFEDLQNMGVSVESFKFNNTTKCNLVDNLAIAIESRLITFPPEEILVEELLAFEYTLSKTGKVQYGAPEGKHDDAVISLALATWGIKSYLHEAQVVHETIQQQTADRQGRGEPIEEPLDDYDTIGGY